LAYFPHKHFDGTTYVLDHLEPTSIRIALDVAGTIDVSLHVQYSCHCFTESFDPDRHRDHHKYTHRRETRAFNVLRYQCSLHLPSLLNGLPQRTVYRAEQDNYTYVARIPINHGMDTYSVFFKLAAKAPDELHMRVQSAYLKPLSRRTKESWRFGSLAGQISGVFEARGKRPRPKKKAP
jgi:hypothetical protein